MARCFFCNYHSKSNSRFTGLNTVKPYLVIICLKCMKKIARLYENLKRESKEKQRNKLSLENIPDIFFKSMDQMIKFKERTKQ